MRRALLVVLFAAAPAGAWEFFPTPVCTLAHDEADASVRITYDPRQSQPYAIVLTRRGAAWPGDGIFALDFAGGRSFTITTNRQRLSDGGSRLTVTDHGFGNLLNGFEFNEIATARIGDTAVPFPLDGIAEPVAAFRACAGAVAD